MAIGKAAEELGGSDPVRGQSERGRRQDDHRHQPGGWAGASSGSRTLLIDLDPQCNATSGLGITPAARHPLVLRQPIHESVLPTKLRRPGTAPRQPQLSGCRCAGPQRRKRGRATSRSICSGELEGYDFVLIDCPPSLGTLTQTALSASTEVLMPIQCEYFAMEGLTQMIQVIRGVMQRFPGRLEFGGIVLTMYDAALELTHEVDAEVRDFFGEIVFSTVVPRDVAVAEAPSHAPACWTTLPALAATRAYIELCMEVLERE